MSEEKPKTSPPKSIDSLERVEQSPGQSIEKPHPTGAISRITSSIRSFLDDWHRRKALAEVVDIVYKPQHAYRDAPELTIDNLSAERLNEMGLERAFIHSNPAIHELFSDFLSVLALKIGDAKSYGLSDKYRQITGCNLAFDFNYLTPILKDLIASEYFLNSHKYLVEINQECSELSDSKGLNPESLFGKLVEVADLKAGKYLFKPKIPSHRYLSKMDLDEELLYQNTESALARSGFDPQSYRLGLLPFAAILADPERFSIPRDNHCLVEVFLREQNSDYSFLTRVSGGRVQLLENCYYGNRKHDIAGRFRCSKNHQSGQIRLVIEEK